MGSNTIKNGSNFRVQKDSYMSLGNCEEDLPKKPVGRLSAVCRPTFGRLLADCRISEIGIKSPLNLISLIALLSFANNISVSHFKSFL